MERDSFIFYRSFYEAIKEIHETEQLKVYQAIMEYALNNNELKIDGISKAIFTLTKPQLDANLKRYLNGKQPKQKQTISKTEAKPKQKTSKKEAKSKQTISKTEANDNVNVNDNENKNDNDNENVNIHFAEFVSMTNAEYEKLVSTYGKDFADQCINVLDNYKGSSGKKYKSDYRAILNWVVERVKQQQPKNNNEMSDRLKRWLEKDD